MLECIWRMKKKTRSVTRKKKTTAQNRLRWRTLCNNQDVNGAPPERQSSAVRRCARMRKAEERKKVSQQQESYQEETPAERMKLFDAISNIAIKLCRTKIQANSESGHRRLQPRREPQTRDKKSRSAAGNQREKGGEEKKKPPKKNQKNNPKKNKKSKITKKSDEKL